MLSSFLILNCLFILGTSIVTGLIISSSYLFRLKAIKDKNSRTKTYARWSKTLYLPTPCYVSPEIFLGGFSTFIIIASIIGIVRDHAYEYLISIALQIIYFTISCYLFNKMRHSNTQALKHIE